MRLKVKTKLENLAVISDFISEAMKQFGIEQETFEVQLAVDEACTNIMQHAYSGESDNFIEIFCSMSGDDLVIQTRDWGKPFDPQSVPVPDIQSKLPEKKLGGLGIFLMKQMMDEVRYIFNNAHKYNDLIMIKHLRRKE